MVSLLIRRARKLYAGEPLSVELKNAFYASNSSIIVPRLSLFAWNLFRSTETAVKLRTLLDLRGTIFAFIHISDRKLHDVSVLDVLAFEAGAFYVMNHGCPNFVQLYALHAASAFFVTRAKSTMGPRRVFSQTTDPTSGPICDQRVVFNGHYLAMKYPERLRRARFKNPNPGKTLISIALPALTICALYESYW